MKKIILLCLMLITLNLSAKEWESYWIAAMEDSHKGDYTSAEHNFNMTINLMEKENDLEHPSIYVDRAYLNLLLNKYEEALSDVNIALFSEKLVVKERVRAVSTRVAARANLGFSDGYQEDMEFLVKNFEVQIENTENHLIIRNMPKCKAFRKSMTDFFILTGLCKDKEDVKILSSDICIVNKTAHTAKLDNELNNERKNDSESLTGTTDISKQFRRDPLVIQSCKLWCDANTQAAIAWCVNFPALCQVNACNSAVFEIQNNCHACCQNGFSQETCATPFGDIVSVMQKYLKSPCGCN